MSKKILLTSLVELREHMINSSKSLNDEGYTTKSNELAGASSIVQDWIDGLVKDAEKDFLNTTKINP